MDHRRIALRDRRKGLRRKAYSNFQTLDILPLLVQGFGLLY